MSAKHHAGYLPWDRSGNRLLLKSELGLSKPTNYDIPQQNFTYGRITAEDPEHANQLMYKWKYHQTSSNINIGKEKDLIQTNKKCLNNLLHTAPHFSTYRKSSTLYKDTKEGNNHMKINLPQQNHAYGKAGDLEDPIKLVIANDYGETDKVMRHSFYAARDSVMGRNNQPSRRISCHITKNHKILKEATSKRLDKFNWDKREDHWKLSKFNNAGIDSKVSKAWKKE